MRLLIFLLFVSLFVWNAVSACAQAVVARPAPAAAAEPVVEADASTADESDAATEATKPDAPQYVRISQTDDNKPKALQTAIVRFTGKPGTQHAGKIVDLVGVVHIGQAEYYRDLGVRLAKYDKVLYELVAPDGTRIRPEDLKARRSLLASVQTGMKDMLNLEYQLERIDYMSQNFRHADMSPEEFVQDLERRGDSVWKMAARMMGAGLATQAKTGGDAGILFAFLSKDRPKLMKRAMARQMIDMETVTAGINDENGENTLIKGRNAKAFKILKQELAGDSQEVAVFYGAGHLSDMADRLEQEFGMTAGETTWLDAWDLTRN